MNLRVLSLFLSFISVTLYAQETVIINETFDNNDKQWPIFNENDYSTEVKKGKYIMKANVEDKTYWFYKFFNDNLNCANENFTVEVTFDFIKGETNTPFGLISNMYNNKSNYVKFLIAVNGYYKVSHYYSEKDHLYADWTQTSLINEKGSNKLKIERFHNICRYYINDQLVLENADISYYGHGFGFQLNGKSEVHVDNFILKKSTKNYHLVNNAITGRKKERLSTLINSEYDELSPIISYDGKTLYVTRDGHPDNMGTDDNDVWISNLGKDGTWGRLYNAGFPINNTGQNFVVGISPDDNTLYLGNTYKSDGSSDGAGISFTNRTEDGWEIPKPIKIDGYKNEDTYVSYFLAPDNKVLLLAINDGNSYGKKDIMVSFLQEDGSFSKPKNLGNVVNSVGQEFNPTMAADGKTMYYCSHGHESYGSADIFMTKRLDDTWTNWSKPQNLGPEINTEDWDGKISISAKGDWAYIVSSEGSNNNTSDIFRISLGEAKPEPVVLIYGKVLNRKNNQPLSADITYNNLATDEVLGTAISNPKDGSYKIILPLGKVYSFMAEKTGFYPISENFDVNNLTEYTEIERNLYLSPIDLGETIRLNNIFFEYDKADLKSESESELNRLIKFLKDNPTVQIEISGHTDDQGSDEYNKNLSQKRVNSVVAYLTSKGIEKERLKGVGYGESKPISENTSEEGRAKNRRVEFTILKK